MRRAARPIAALSCALLCACSGGAEMLTADDMEHLRELGPLPALPPSPTNRHADDPRAIALGQRLFFDKRMSADGQIACVSCHKPEAGLADVEPVSTGAFGRKGHRAASAIVNVAYNDFLFWDLRTDSVWSQPLQAIEGEVEGDFTRLQVAHFVAAQHRADYERVFGPLPPLAGLPVRGKPGDAVWDALPEATRAAVDRVFANVGKVLEAYERRLVSRNSRFDRWLAGDAGALTAREQRGAMLFAREDRGACILCHTGPNLTDNSHHNLGVHEAMTPPDEGAFAGLAMLRANVFNAAGAFSDDVAFGADKLRYLEPLPIARGAFKTPSLRDATRRKVFGHAGDQTTVAGWIRARYQHPDPAARFVGEREGTLALIRLTDADVEDIAAFLVALEGEPLPTQLLAPPP